MWKVYTTALFDFLRPYNTRINVYTLAATFEIHVTLALTSTKLQLVKDPIISSVVQVAHT